MPLMFQLLINAQWTHFSVKCTKANPTHVSTNDFLDSINSDPKDPIQFPALSKSHSSYPPTYIATCGLDPLRDDGKVLELALKEAGVKVKRDHYEGYPHYFWIFPSITEGQKFVQNLLAGVQFVLGYK